MLLLGHFTTERGEMIPTLTPTTTLTNISVWSDWMASSLWNTAYVIIGVTVGALLLYWLIHDITKTINNLRFLERHQRGTSWSGEGKSTKFDK